MKTFVVRYVEEVEYECKVKAKTEDEAREIVNNGETPSEEVIDRNHFQITEVYETEEEDNDEPKTRLEQMSKLTHDPIVD